MEKEPEIFAHGAANKQLHHHVEGAQIGDDALHAHDDDLRFGDARGHAGIALVRDEGA